MTNSNEITLKGKAYAVEALSDPSDIEAPFRLIRQRDGKAFRLYRNNPQPNRCFLVAEENAFDSMESLNLLVEIQADNTLKPLT